MSNVALSGISKWFPCKLDAPLHVLSDIGFEAQDGRILAIIGASGCGKSTLLNIIAGLTPADQGHVAIGGVPAGGDAVVPLSVMFQEDRLLPWRSAARNVGFGLEAAPITVTEKTRRIRDALDMVGLSDFAEAFPHELSGGMRSRVALARSLATRPEVLLMDEPFSKLDPGTRTQIHGEVLRIAAAHAVTVIFVTHDVEEAVVLADRIVVLQPRPGTIREVVEIDLPRPRDVLTLKVTEAVRSLRALL
ncbi:hypothetical protein P775_15980 [Puniceibacterium antarcticum]|uniref:ABC transporter domain-containing protein n=1 Tax=Puniceibacterium antarcticum TaxID=1206336 RepID=A0A2G8RC63_9RHOB|nr:ABC transporter ATP-binding protein [Puniceibacterium antarcticum]PIL19165.1 hypothetical protein P775_15980 [Puniceibacterium antarcticum]